LTCIAALDDRNYLAPQARDFSTLANLFFSGLPVPEDFDDPISEENQTTSVVKALLEPTEKAVQVEDDQDGQQARMPCTQDQETAPIVRIRYHTGGWSEVLRENPINDKSLVCFLQDCAMANILEEACSARRALSSGVKVYRSSQYTFIRESNLLETVSSAVDYDKASDKSPRLAVGGNDHVVVSETDAQGNEAPEIREIEETKTVKVDSSTGKAQRKLKGSKRKANKHIPKRKKIPQLDDMAADEKSIEDDSTIREDSEVNMEPALSPDNGIQHSKRQRGQEIVDDANDNETVNELTANSKQRLLEEKPQSVKEQLPVNDHHLGTDGFEPHSFLLSADSCGIDEAQWEVVKPKSAKQRPKSRQSVALRPTQGSSSQYTPRGMVSNTLYSSVDIKTDIDTQVFNTSQAGKPSYNSEVIAKSRTQFRKRTTFWIRRFSHCRILSSWPVIWIR
jgi:hypothetical protein